MSSLLNKDELIKFTFRFIDVILNNINTPKFKKKKSFKTIETFAKLRGLYIEEDVYSFRINDKSFVVALFIIYLAPAIRCSQYFMMDKNFSNDNKVLYIFIPSQEKYYSYDDDNLTKILYSIWNMISNNHTFKINCYNDDINIIVENTIIFMILTIVLYFTLEDNLDTKREINDFISKHYGSNNCIYAKVINNIYDDLFKNVESIFSDSEAIIIENFERIVNNILDYLEPHYRLLKVRND